VNCDDDRLALASNVLEEMDNTCRALRVEPRRRLVSEQDLRSCDQLNRNLT
jgi:hypothetical protein